MHEQVPGVIEALFVGGPWHGQIREVPRHSNHYIMRHSNHYIMPDPNGNWESYWSAGIDSSESSGPAMIIYERRNFRMYGLALTVYSCKSVTTNEIVAEAIAIAGRNPGEPKWITTMIHDMEGKA